MRTAVLSLTRDRLDYTSHCFKSLRENAGCDYHHLILDQGSTDGSREWLEDYTYSVLVPEPENIGIHAGLNKLVGIALADYAPDVVVKFDNDCELHTPGTIAAVAERAHTMGWLVSPRIEGLRATPQTIGVVGDLEEKNNIGGICMAIPAWVFNTWRFDETLPPWGGDDIGICQWFRGMGGHVGYLRDYVAWHIDGTDEQYERFPDYRARSLSEGHPA